jgi:hypothetical protein
MGRCTMIRTLLSGNEKKYRGFFKKRSWCDNVRRFGASALIIKDYYWFV